ncbi:helix-turn-helix domain-containing protein [Eubacteriales bacterium OttesenSCG-928-N13]|nr:helix-turn-helix domain-containing protein [Eubacteriales bacterium OttesenSCG-928-N13]
MQEIMDYIAFGKRIRARRKELRLTQAQLAKMSDISLAFIGHIERGGRKASIETLLHIASSLETTPDALLCDSIVTKDHAGLFAADNAELLVKIQKMIDEHIDKYWSMTK